jgi:ammonia channel protein AmtB
VLMVCGTLFLWLGWIAFNIGSITDPLSAQAADRYIASRVAACTMLSGAAAGLVAAHIEKYRERRAARRAPPPAPRPRARAARHRAWVSTPPVAHAQPRAARAAVNGTWSVDVLANGTLSGLVSITAGCSVVPSWAAVLIGMIGGCLYCGSSRFVLRRLRVDDVLDAFSVHGACGMWGMIAAALFATPSLSHGRGGGLFYGGANLLGAAVVGTLAIVAWSGLISMILYLTLRRFQLCARPRHAHPRSHDARAIGSSRRACRPPLAQTGCASTRRRSWLGSTMWHTAVAHMDST